MFENVYERLKNTGIIPVVKIEDSQKVLTVAQSLLKGGITAIEIAFRTDNGAEGYNNICSCINAVKTSLPEMLVGAGTVINAELAQMAVQAGAEFIVSPGFNFETVNYCLEYNIPIIPGVSTPSEIESALLKNLHVLKYFPAELNGGIKMLKALKGPFPDVNFVPTGGINLENISSYLKCSNVIACGGSWIVDPSLIKEEKWDTIVQLSIEAMNCVLGFEFKKIRMFCTDDIPVCMKEQVIDLFGIKNADKVEWLNISETNSLKSEYLGQTGIIVYNTLDIKRAVYYLNHKGIKVKKVCEDGSVYLDNFIGGYGVCLVENK